MSGTQRTDGFKGGIKAGQKAADEQASKLDGYPKAYIEAAYEDYSWNTGKWRSGYTGEELLSRIGSKMSGKSAGFRPDGGVFCDDDGNPVLAFECKKQGSGGNALERWAKNAQAAKSIGVGKYVTFCVGDGFFDGNSAEGQLRTCVGTACPEKEELWGADGTQFECYRWRTFEEAKAELPEIIDGYIGEYEAGLEDLDEE